MDCRDCRDALSARLDGELGENEDRAVATHLQRCASCTAHAEELSDLTRWTRLQPAEAMPDLTPRIMSRLRPQPVAAGRQGWLRVGLVVWAVVQLAVAAPDLIGFGEHAHHARELLAWHVAVATGFAAVAWRPAWVVGLVPVVAVAAAVLVATAGLDVWAGHVHPVEEASHLLTPIGLLLLWRLARSLPMSAHPEVAG